MNIKKLLISLVLPFLAGGIGSYFTSPAIPGWYQSLEKPFFNPPSWVFGPVWSLLYLLMGIAAYLIWKDIKKKNVSVMFFYWGHLIVNSAWSIVFFGFQSPGYAFLVILILLAMILVIIKSFWGISRAAAYMMIPYALWVSFATILNFSIYLLN